MHDIFHFFVLNTGVVVPNPIFFWTPMFAADTAAANSNDIKTFLANILNTFLIDEKTVFQNKPKHLPRNPPDCVILDRWDLDDFSLAD